MIIEILLDYLNGLTSILPAGVEVKLEKLEKASPSIMLQQQSGTKKTKTYINGSYIAEFPFAVYIRVDGRDADSRIAATNFLNNLGLHFEVGELPDLDPDPEDATGNTATEMEIKDNPSLVYRGDDGFEDYQGLFMLEYSHKKGA